MGLVRSDLVHLGHEALDFGVSEVPAPSGGRARPRSKAACSTRSSAATGRIRRLGATAACRNACVITEL